MHLRQFHLTLNIFFFYFHFPSYQIIHPSEPSIAKAILDEKGARYTVIELDKESDGKAVRAEMGQMLGRTSVPAIW